MAVISPHMVFSNWILVWFILYYFKLISFSPKFAITIGLLENIIKIILMLLWGKSIKSTILFIIIVIIIKILPFYYLRNESYNLKDIYFTFGLFLVYNIWLYINNQNLINNSKMVYDSLINGKNETPAMNLLNKIEKYLQIY